MNCFFLFIDHFSTTMLFFSTETNSSYIFICLYAASLLPRDIPFSIRTAKNTAPVARTLNKFELLLASIM
jgi:hypothetical protein